MPQSATTTLPAQSGADLDGRLSFLELDEHTASQLRELKPLLMRHLPIALDKFYAKIKVTPEVSRFFTDDSHINRAKSAQLGHWGAISSGEIDGTYVGNVRRIGQTHAKIGLEPRWYIGGYALLLEHLFEAIIAESRPKSLLAFNQQTAQQNLVAKLVALTKAAMLDMDFSISTYIEAAENARLKAEAERQQVQRDAEARQRAADAERQRIQEAIAAERADVLKVITTALSELSKKNLAHRISDALPAEFERVGGDYNSASRQLDQALQAVMQRIGTITTATEQILSASVNLSQRTQTTAASLEESAAALEETTVSVQSTAVSTTRMRELIARASKQAADGGAIVQEAVGAMTKIEGSSKEIGQIIGVIDDIAFQTNLLALNAGVEAARAGEHGRGFAVVASEVRALAQRSAESARAIKNLVSTAQENVADGVKLVTTTGHVFSDISDAIGNVNSVMTEIAAAAQQQASALSEVSSAVATMDHDTQENAAMAEELTTSTNTLATESNELKSLVTAFETSGTAGSAHPDAPPRLRVVS